MNLIKNSKIYLVGLGILILILLSGSLVFRGSTSRKAASMTSKKAPTSTLGPTSTPSVTPTLTPSPSPQPSPTPTPLQYPAQVLNLSNWKITLPTGSSGHPDEIKQPALNTAKVDPWFVVSSDNAGVRFRAPVNGVTTSGSHYPRSEFREMTNNGMDQANWSSTSGTHTMSLEEAITAVPKFKQHVVAGQIHDASDDILVIRLEYPNLYVNVGGKNEHTLDSNYTLGKKFSIKFVVEGGKIKVYYNGSSDPVYTIAKDFSGAYFKAGAYTQSNCIREINPLNCNDGNYGEVVIYKLDVIHN